MITLNGEEIEELKPKALPCLFCGKDLEQCGSEFQPYGGICVNTPGNYGSTLVDYMNGQELRFNICDECVQKGGEAGRIKIQHFALPVQTDCWIPPQEHNGKKYGNCFIKSIIGWKQVKRSPHSWHPKQREAGEMEYIHGADFAARWATELRDNPDYRWNLDDEGNQAIIQDWKDHA